MNIRPPFRSKQEVVINAPSCIEKDIEIVPMEKIVTVLPEDHLW